MKRREFIALLGGGGLLLAAKVRRARGQQPAKLPTIGYLGASTPSFDSHRVGAFVQRLRELGWIEGRTVTIEYRWSEGRTERYPEIAAEFVRLKVDVIVTTGGPGTTGGQYYRPVAAADRCCHPGQCRQSQRRARAGRGSGSSPHARPCGGHIGNPARRLSPESFLLRADEVIE
jgi:hypothetical protein